MWPSEEEMVMRRDYLNTTISALKKEKSNLNAKISQLEDELEVIAKLALIKFNEKRGLYDVEE